ncbi:MAG TPA: hypothetical protein PK286_01165 [Devosia sp.]|nr:hypothetical protein [Devosia sp.]
MDTAPLERLAYTLTSADALAYEALPREMTGWRKWAFLLWLAAAGVVLALLPRDWVGPEYGWRFWLALAVLFAAFWGIATLVMTLNVQRRARHRIPAARAVELTRRGNRLEITDAGRSYAVTYDAIADVTEAGDHLFITAPPEVIIVPLRAFESREQMSGFGREVDRLSQEAAP